MTPQFHVSRLLRNSLSEEGQGQGDDEDEDEDAFSFKRLASSSTQRRKASNRSLRRGVPKTAKKWSSGATTTSLTPTDREPMLARPNADGATARPRGGGGGRDARGRGNRRWRRRGGEAAIRSAETRRRCGRGRLASASHRRPLLPRPPPTAR